MGADKSDTIRGARIPSKVNSWATFRGRLTTLGCRASMEAESTKVWEWNSIDISGRLNIKQEVQPPTKQACKESELTGMAAKTRETNDRDILFFAGAPRVMFPPLHVAMLESISAPAIFATLSPKMSFSGEPSKPTFS